MVARAGTGGAASGDRGERRRERVGAVGEIYGDFDTGGETEGAKSGGGGEADRGDYTAGIGEHQTGEFSNHTAVLVHRGICQFSF